MDKMADFWEMLTMEDKQFILGILKSRDPNKYGNLHVAHLVLLKLSTVKHAIRNARGYYLQMYGNIAKYSSDRKFKSMRKRVLQRLSPDLMKKAQLRKWREQQKRT